ncbi:MAG: hypothetical protein IJI45_00455 [Anaerolineaceae bacterium]|nr:hypothetical protein [Anaerolineaceae bacterium]
MKRAVDLAVRRAEAGPVYTYGKIIHNTEVVKELKEKGIVPVESLSELGPGATVVIRAHGVPPEVLAECAARGLETVDATCPFGYTGG